MFVTQEYDTDHGSGWAGRSQIATMFMTRNSFIPTKNTLGWKAVVSCKGELILLRETEFSAEFCMFTDVHKNMAVCSL
jgi:hypothetical protein